MLFILYLAYYLQATTWGEGQQACVCDLSLPTCPTSPVVWHRYATVAMDRRYWLATPPTTSTCLTPKMTKPESWRVHLRRGERRWGVAYKQCSCPSFRDREISHPCVCTEVHTSLRWSGVQRKYLPFVEYCRLKTPDLTTNGLFDLCYLKVYWLNNWTVLKYLWTNQLMISDLQIMRLGPLGLVCGGD